MNVERWRYWEREKRTSALAAVLIAIQTFFFFYFKQKEWILNVPIIPLLDAYGRYNFFDDLNGILTVHNKEWNKCRARIRNNNIKNSHRVSCVLCRWPILLLLLLFDDVSISIELFHKFIYLPPKDAHIQSSNLFISFQEWKKNSKIFWKSTQQHLISFKANKCGIAWACAK